MKNYSYQNESYLGGKSDFTTTKMEVLYRIAICFRERRVPGNGTAKAHLYSRARKVVLGFRL